MYLEFNGLYKPTASSPSPAAVFFQRTARGACDALGVPPVWRRPDARASAGCAECRARRAREPGEKPRGLQLTQIKWSTLW